MSHSIGVIKFSDGTIRYYEYDGTCDIILSCHYSTREEMQENWRNQPDKDCTCGCEESVSIYTSYGFGYYIAGKACKHCCSVRPNKFDFDIINPEDTEDWAKHFFEK